jgi:pyruvate,water dikinase
VRSPRGWGRPAGSARTSGSRRLGASFRCASSPRRPISRSDLARCCARSLGRELAERGALDAPDDVFYLTADELARTPASSLRERVAFRRARRDRYLALSIPETWTGMPEPTTAAPASGDRRVLLGVPVAPGIVEGAVRVMKHPAEAEALEPGEILVCHTTDPSWASLFPVVAAVVIDIGGPLSHGAIVARELGLPCVINTREGTRLLRTGERVRVDGALGSVERLSPAPD